MEKGVFVPETKNFEDLKELVSNETLKGIKEMGYKEMTEIQYKTVIPLLAGK